MSEFVAWGRRRAADLLTPHARDRRIVAVARRRTAEALSPFARDIRATRRRLARRFLRGDGIEIGALHLPLWLPRGARARYVDRMPVTELRRHYPELEHFDLTEPDVIDDGEILARFADASVDFVVANHFVEHSQNPIATLGNHLRVVHPGGVVFMAVPDKRHTFDREREITPLEHVRRDYDEGPAWSRAQHFEEWARFVEGVADAEVASRARELEAQDYSIHYHVWTPAAFAELLVECRRILAVPFELEALESVRHEFVVVLRKPG